MELAMTNGFMELNQNEMEMVDGGASVAGIICSSLAIVAGACCVIGGVCSLMAPEPTGLTKVAGVVAIIGGVAAMGSGIAGIVWACE